MKTKKVECENCGWVGNATIELAEDGMARRFFAVCQECHSNITCGIEVNYAR